MRTRATGGLSRGDRKRHTREALLAAGLEEFTERGLDAPSLDDICARAGFTRGAFYVHFEHRDAFLVAVMERLLSVFLETIVTSADPAHDLHRTVARFTEVAEAVAAAPAAVGRGAGIPFHQLLDACRRSPAVRERFRLLAEEASSRLLDATHAGQGAGALREDPDPRRMAELLVVLALGVLASLEAGLPFRARDLGATVVSLLRPDGRRDRAGPRQGRRAR